MARAFSFLYATSLALFLACQASGAERKAAFTDPALAGPDFAVQGEYLGTVQTGEGDVQYGIQLIALGGGTFRAVGYVGGLPGAGWNKKDKLVADGQTKDGVVTIALTRLPEGVFTAAVKEGAITVKDSGGTTVATFKKVQRKSPTLGAKPPAGAVVLFDGSTADNFIGGRITPDGLLMEGATSKQKFGGFTIHLEFRTPFEPYARGQGRGNSGFYAQGRYEVQILDSFGLEGESNECGGIYGVSKPEVNMCLPPLSWQTYDVDFTTAQYQDGKLATPARMTVRHNGVLIQDNVEIPGTTIGAPVRQGPETGPVFLQNHGNPLRFRNIWVVETRGKTQ